MEIPLAKPFLGDEEKEAVKRVIDSKRLATGETVRELEVSLARKFQRKYCVVVSSGTAALYLGLKALKARRVIIPALTCNAVLHAALNADASVTFADVDEETHNLDLSSLPQSQLEKTGAVVVTHTYGHTADMDKLDYYVKKYNLVLVEDFAQATGGYFRDRMLGSLGKISVTSFYATKGMATGHGGALLTDDEELYLRCVYGRGSRTTSYYDGIIPMNLQMTDIQAALGLVQLSKLDTMIKMRQRVANRYTQELSPSPVGLIHPKAWTKHTYYKYAIVLPEGIQKQAFIERMKDFGIEVGKLYDPPLHKTRIAIDIVGKKVKLPTTEYLSPRTVSLPMFPELSDEEVNKVCGAIKSVISGLGDEA